MAGPGLAGIAVQLPFVIVSDKSNDGRDDIWHCLNAEDGRELWTLTYSAPGELDYTNAPRATPVITDGKVFLLGALGHLHCVELASGSVLWKRNLLTEFGGTPLTWGFCASPLLDGNRLIVGTASADSALVALNRLTGAVLWKTAGNPTAHSGMIVGVFRGRRQIIGYDSISLGGWDSESGNRLWTMTPDEPRDFNVPTPLNLGGRLLLATENNGARLYDFKANGAIDPTPIARNDNFKPNTSTPVLVDALVYGFADGLLYCLDPGKRLATRWATPLNGGGDYASLIGGNGHILIASVTGELSLIKATGESCRVQSSLHLFEGKDPQAWTHPALVGNRLYLRSQSEAVCLKLNEKP